MKNRYLALLAIIPTLLFSACDPGEMEYGYVYNPKGVLYKMFQSLKNNDYSDDWSILFSGKMICYYDSKEGIRLLKKTIGNMETAFERFTLEQPVLVKTGKTIKGYQDVMGTIKKGERYEARIRRNSDQKLVIKAMISCFQEYSGGSDHHYCMITDLENYLYGNPNLPVCEGL